MSVVKVGLVIVRGSGFEHLHLGQPASVDGCTDATTAERHREVNTPRCNRSRQGNNEVGIIIFKVQFVCTEVFDGVPGSPQR
jgi:hypothetical protein